MKPAIPNVLVDRYDQLVLEKIVRNGTEQVHACIFPKTALPIEDFMSQDVSDSSQFVVRRMLVESEDVLDDIVSIGKGFSGDVGLLP